MCSANFICGSVIHEHCRSPDNVNEVAVLQGISHAQKRIDYILYTFNGGETVQCCEFSYSSLKDIISNLRNVEIVIELDSGALAETGWELIFDEDFDGLALDEVATPLSGGFRPMPIWMRSFLSQLNKKYNHYIYSKGETESNTPLLSSLILVYGWNQMRDILDAYPQVDNSPLVNKTWSARHPIIYIARENFTPEELLYIHTKYFERTVRFDTVVLRIIN
jgi:hypothetical protein